jgi:SAM-dependent methyltransferase
MNYNDYIIRDNKEFIRDFDRMYREISDPWGQQERGDNDESFSIALSVLKSFYRKGLIVDIGCGPGHLSKYVIEKLGDDNYLGCDISPQAVKIAKEKNPNLQFETLNIITDYKSWDASVVIILKTIYYCAPEIDNTIQNIYNTLTKGGHLLYSYNMKEDSFTNRYLDIEKLRYKLNNGGLFKKKFISDYFLKEERIAIDIYEKI